MGEIVIGNPVVGNDFLRNHSAEDKWLQGIFLSDITSGKITSAQYPKGCELGAGNGFVSNMLTWNGWKASNLMLVDRYVPDMPFVHGAVWKTWDIMALGDAISHHKSIPEDVSQYKEAFDITLIVTVTDKYCGALLGYFLRPGGIAFAQPFSERLRRDTKHWRPVKGTQRFVEKI